MTTKGDGMSEELEEILLLAAFVLLFLITALLAVNVDLWLSR